jgi:hypothetical protein
MSKHPDDLPTVPKVFTYIRIAATPEEEAQAQYSATVCKAAPVTNWERMTDDDLIELAREPEFYAGCTPLERELIVRLSTQLELARRAA